MSIQMIGIEHSMAGVEMRELFSFTKKKSALAMQWFCSREGIAGCVILSTCNRTELWVSSEEEQEQELPLYEQLCEWKALDPDRYRAYFVGRQAAEAVKHLFRLTCGLQSQILGEDQILTQVKEALSWSREHYCADRVLETLFRMAVTAAKKVKTEIRFTTADQSAIHAGIRQLHAEGRVLAGMECMVIGNGEMGKLSAAALIGQGAKVTVTVRQYRSGVVQIPRGARMIPYGERMELFPRCDLVVSATASPNYTIREEEVRRLELSRPVYIFDLAVPRDVEAQVREHPLIRLWNMDDLRQSQEVSERLERELEAAGNILRQQMEAFWDWYGGKDIYPRVRQICKEAAHDMELRLDKDLRRLQLQEEEYSHLEGRILQAADKVVNKMIYGMREHLSDEEFRNCIDSLDKVFARGKQPSQNL